MEETEVVEKVTIPTDWVKSLVVVRSDREGHHSNGLGDLLGIVVEKPKGKLRVCLQATTLPHAKSRRCIIQIGRRTLLQQTGC